ncbi:MAG: hypothetical protein F6J95_023750 [Leptolyngbya sp. SIO1E4]|nr:hypothetical protein [Leptolyngbya sp. SIO1E4]
MPVVTSVSLQACITSVGPGRWRLSLWEPAPLTEHRIKPFLFKVNVTFCDANELSAISLLYGLDATQLLQPWRGEL